MATSYLPGLSKENWKFPFGPVVAVCFSCVDSLTMVTCASVTIAPEASVTIPLIAPVTMLCAFVGALMTSKIAGITNRNFRYGL